MSIYKIYLENLLKVYRSSNKKITFVMGNTTSDMDSTTSSIVLSLIMNFRENNNFLKSFEESDKVFIPLINSDIESFYHRFDIELVFKSLGIDENNLLYYNQIDWKNDQSKIILVDHHELDSNQQFLDYRIIGIFDHHNDRKFNYSFYKNLDFKIVEFPRCSALCLILEELLYGKHFKTEKSYYKELLDNILHKENTFVDMLLSALILDGSSFNINFLDEIWTISDLDLANKILGINNKFIILSQKSSKDDQKKSDDESSSDEEVNISNHKYEEVNQYFKYHHKSVKQVFKILDKIKKDVNKNLGLGIKGLFEKDKKNYDISTANKKVFRLEFSTVPLKYKHVVKHFDEKNLHEYLIKKCSENNIDIVVFKTNYKKKTRVYNHYFKNSIQNDEFLKFYMNGIKEELSKIDSFIDWIEDKKFGLLQLVTNKTVSRKIIMPIIQSVLNKY